MEIRAGDRKGTGYFDFWEVDADADGTVDLSYGYLDKMARDNEVRHEDLSGDPAAWPALNLERREKAIADNLALIGIMRGILKAGEERFEPDAAERFYREHLRGWQTEYGHGEKMFASRETERFYTDIIRLRYFHRILRLELPADAPRAELLKLFWSGEPGQAGDWLRRHFRVPAPEPGVRAALGLSVTNRSDLKLWRHPVSVDLRTAFPDRAIGLDGVTVLETVERLEPRPQISQCDDLDGDGRADELVFLADLRPGETRSFRLELRVPPEFPSRVRASSSSGEARWESGTSRFDWTMKTGIRYTGKDPGIIFGSEGRDPSPGPASGGPVLELGAPGRTAELSAVRSGPVRAIVRAGGAPLVVLAYAEPDITELRWTGDASIHMRMAGSSGASLRTASGATAWQTWDGDIGTSVLWSERSGLRWDAGSKTLSLASGAGSGRLWIHGYRRSGDRTPFRPGRSNWIRDLDTLGRMIDEPVSIELGPVRTGPETK
jgi:hypothetical protein